MRGWGKSNPRQGCFVRAMAGAGRLQPLRGGYLGFYNRKRPRTSLDRKRPDHVYFGGLGMAEAA